MNWSRDWDESFDDDLMARIESFLGAEPAQSCSAIRGASRLNIQTANTQVAT